MQLRVVVMLFNLLSTVAANSQNFLARNMSLYDIQDTLYKTYYNKMKLVCDDIPCDSLTLVGSGYSIIKSEKCDFYIRVLNDSAGFLKIFRGNIQVGVINPYITNTIPMPMIEVNNEHNENTTTISRLDSVFCKSMYKDQYNNNIKFSVLSFVIEFRKNGKSFYLEHTCGNKFSNDCLEKFKKLIPMDRVILTSIVVVDDQENIYSIEKAEFSVGR